MRNASEGVALAAIVAKETTEGKWSGSGGGLGFGTGGLGLFIGGMSGTKREQSQRAKEFEAPEKPAFNWFYVWAPLFAAVAIALFFWLATGAVSLLGGSDGGTQLSGPVERVNTTFGPMVQFLGWAVPAAAMIGGSIWFIFGGSNRRQKAEDARFKRAEAASRVKEAIYYRLRYVEADHIVFDPKTGREVPAERGHIQTLLDELTRAENA